MSVEATATPAQSATPAGPPLPRFDIVFLDLDETLCSWMAPALAKHKTDLFSVIRDYRWPPGDNRRVYAIMGMEKSAFWKPIDQDQYFWDGLPRAPHFEMLVKLAQRLSDTVRVLTSPHEHSRCYSGKYDWCQKHLPITFNKPILCSDKHLLARPGRLLIDDQDDKVNAFREAGGDAILIPQHWNSAHAAAPFGPLFYLAQELEKIRARQENLASWQNATCPPLDSMGVQLINGLGETIPPTPASP